MKKSIIILLISISVFYGCSKKSNPAPTPPVTIIGKWEKDSTIFWEYVNNAPSPITKFIYTDPEDFIQFNSNGTGVISAGSNGSYINTNFDYSIVSTYLTFTEGATIKKDTIILSKNSLYIHDDLLVKITGGSTYEYITNDYYNR